jgi:hypothetical protein
VSRKQSLTEAAGEVIPMPLAASWAGIGTGGRAKAYCPFGFDHPDGGTEPALRVYRDHAWCFSCQLYFTVSSLLAAVWELPEEDAAAEALRRHGWKPADYAHLWEEASRPPAPDREALAKALETWCRAACPDWEERQYDDVVAEKTARLRGLLHLVTTEFECRTWLQACKTILRPYLS